MTSQSIDYKNKSQNVSNTHKNDNHYSSPSKSPSPSTHYNTLSPIPPTKSTHNMSAKEFQELRVDIFENRLGYTDDNNPFGDSTLTRPFFWKEKYKIQKIIGDPKRTKTIDGLLENTKRKVDEIEAVKKRREQREIEQKLLEEQRELLDREREQQNFEEWAQKEEEFHRRQTIQKTELRIEQGREQPLDIIMKGIEVLKGKTYSNYNSLNFTVTEIFDDLPIEKVEQMLADIEIFNEEEKIEEFKNFWSSLCVIGQETVKKLKQKERETEAQINSISIAPFRDANLQIPNAIITQIDNLLANKTSNQLTILQAQVTHKLSNTSDDVDPTYWEAIQMRLPLFKAKAIINEIKSKWLNKIENIKNELKNLNNNISPFSIKSSPSVSTPNQPQNEIEIENFGQFSPTLEPYDEEDDNIYTQENINEYSPSLHPFDEFESDEIVDAISDLNARTENRLNLIAIQRQKRLEIMKFYTQNDTHTEDDLIDPAHKMTTFDDFVRKEKKAMEGDEEIMTSNMEYLLDNHYQWEEKYKARKPRYFNRVKSGYEWSKYNQTHYDRENPPPKAVQGYKFNIFYPDLINKHISPTWTLEPCQGTHDTVIIRFHAGPPYEDVAFKIINREWSLDLTRGFRNTFDKGILQLHFTFKRFRYRR